MKIGKFRINGKYINEQHSILYKIFANMIPVKASSEFYLNGIEYTAISKIFEEIDVKIQLPPIYRIYVTDDMQIVLLPADQEANIRWMPLDTGGSLIEQWETRWKAETDKLAITEEGTQDAKQEEVKPKRRRAKRSTRKKINK